MLGVVDVDLLVVVELDGFSVVVLVEVVLDVEVVEGLVVVVLDVVDGVVLVLCVVDVPAERVSHKNEVKLNQRLRLRCNNRVTAKRPRSALCT